MKVLVAGGCGFLGSAVVNALQFAHEVVVYDNLLYCDEYLKPVKFVRGDVLDYPHLQTWLTWADAVIWLAAIVGDGACQLNPALSIATNQNAVEYLAEHFAGKVVFTSSCSVYGANDKEVDEDSPLAPLSIYAETKIKAEQAFAGSNALILRLGTLHGLSERVRFDLAVNVLAMKAASQGKVEVFGGAQYRPFLAVQDAAAFIVRSLSFDCSGIYNLASENLTILQVAERIQELVPGVEIVRMAMEYEDHRNYRVSCAKVRRELGFAPLLTIDDSIVDIVNAVKEGRIKDLASPRYANATALERGA